MKTIALGKNGLMVSEQGYGCMGLTTAYGAKLPDEEIIAMLKKVYENGVTLWDTANIYCFSDFTRLLTLRSPIVCQEEIIGKAIAEVGRENLIVSTKTGLQIRLFPKLSVVPDGSPEFIRKQCEASLKRLGVDYLDMFYLHRIDQTIPIEVTMAEMKKLVQEGKVKYVGLSECSAKTLRRACKVHPVSMIQMEWSLWERGIEKELIPACVELGVGVVAYSPLGRGFLGGSIKNSSDLKSGDFRATQGRMVGEGLEKNLKMLERVEEIAKSKNCTTAQLSLAWLQNKQDLLKGNGVVAIPGTTKEKNLLSNVASVDIKLTAEEMKALEDAVAAEDIHGERYEGGHITWEADNNPELPPEEAATYYA